MEGMSQLNDATLAVDAARVGCVADFRRDNVLQFLHFGGAMAVRFIRSEDDVFPAEASWRTAKRIRRVEVVLDGGERVELHYVAVEMMERLREGLAESKVAHLEMDEETISAERAAELMGVARPTIYTWQDRGRIGRVDVGAKRMVPLADVEKLKNSEVRQATFAAARRQNLHEPEEPLTTNEMRDFRTLFEQPRRRTRQ